jgi:hypothetical protein
MGGVVANVDEVHLDHNIPRSGFSYPVSLHRA